MRLFYLIILLVISICGIGQSTTKQEFDRELDLMMRRHSKLHSTLSMVRGPGIQALAKNVTTPDLEYRLKYWRPEDLTVGLIIYEQNERSLSMFYLDNHGRKVQALKGITKLHLQKLEELLKRELGAELTLDSLGRGPTSERTPVNIAKATLYADSLSAILLPKTIPFKKLDHLIIIPTNNIGALPFSMLKLDDSTTLIDQMSYSIVPTINEFVYMNDVNSIENPFKMLQTPIYAMDSSTSILFVANPTFSDRRFINHDLPGAEKEYEFISRQFPNVTLLKNEGATKAAVVTRIYDHPILYFATHGIASVKEPVHHSALFLAGKEPKQIMFTYDEIMSLGSDRLLSAELVILSACQTGLGYARGAGIISLARAFQVSGAQNVVMSLWNISDNKTPELMELFFKYLKTELPLLPFRAMQLAIKEFKKDNSNPVYWAPFSIYGVPY